MNFILNEKINKNKNNKRHYKKKINLISIYLFFCLFM